MANLSLEAFASFVGSVQPRDFLPLMLHALTALSGGQMLKKHLGKACKGRIWSLSEDQIPCHVCRHGNLACRAHNQFNLLAVALYDEPEDAQQSNTFDVVRRCNALHGFSHTNGGKPPESVGTSPAAILPFSLH